jgi:hypothetical protein
MHRQQNLVTETEITVAVTLKRLFPPPPRAGMATTGGVVVDIGMGGIRTRIEENKPKCRFFL